MLSVMIELKMCIVWERRYVLIDIGACRRFYLIITILDSPALKSSSRLRPDDFDKLFSEF